MKSRFPDAEFHMHIYTGSNEEEIIEEINKTQDVYLFSSQGLKDQEITISSMMPKLKNIKVASGIG